MKLPRKRKGYRCIKGTTRTKLKKLRIESRFCSAENDERRIRHIHERQDIAVKKAENEEHRIKQARRRENTHVRKAQNEERRIIHIQERKNISVKKFENEERKLTLRAERKIKIKTTLKVIKRKSNYFHVSESKRLKEIRVKDLLSSDINLSKYFEEIAQGPTFSCC